MRIINIKSLMCIVIIFTIIIYTGCSKSENGDSDSNPVGGNYSDTTSAGDTAAKTFSFRALGLPVNRTIYLEQVENYNDTITLAVKVKGGTDVYGAVLEIVYDSSKIKYESSERGSYLGGVSETFFLPFLVDEQDGRLHIAITKKGNGTGTKGSGVLSTIVLKALTDQVSTSIKFNATISNLMSATSGNPISGTTWLGGELTYQ